MLKNNQPSDQTRDNHVRRPLAVRIARDLRRQHPNWTQEEVNSEAKAQAIAQMQGRHGAAK